MPREPGLDASLLKRIPRRPLQGACLCTRSAHIGRLLSDGKAWRAGTPTLSNASYRSSAVGPTANRDRKAVARGSRQKERTPFAGVQEASWRAVRPWHTFCLQVGNLANHGHGRSARHANGACKRCLLEHGSPLL